MPHTLTFSFDPAYGLTLVAGESVVTDLAGVHITQQPNGRYDCAISRAGGAPVRLVASGSAEGRGALARATGQERSDVPGFVEIPVPAVVEPPPIPTEELAQLFGWEPAPAP
ncbi:MAG: hypothetical protein J0H57_28020 [Rhodospirillales bacterium]|nr:hypothetical protein [Rhodospirillales bacterium]